MKRFMKLLTVLLMLITVSCKTIPQKKNYTLAPFPKRKELPKASSVQDMAVIIEMQNSLIAEWELWGKDVREMLENDGTSNSGAD